MTRIILIFLFLIAPTYFVYLVAIYMRTRVPYVITPRACLPKIMKELHITRDTVIYDLGCGKGDVLFAAEKFHPKKLVGYELSPLHAWYAQIKAWILRSNAQIYRRDFFSADISDADIIYLFLVQSVVEKIWVKIQKEARPGTRVVVLANTIPDGNGQRIELHENNPSGVGGLFVYTIAPSAK